MKKLQILCVDNDLVQKVDLQIGNNIIGRSVVTGCDDGQIIKHAVTITLSSDNEMTVTPVSPCYMKSTESSRWQLLKLGTAVPIKPGDICSLIPYKCWFKVILIPDIMEHVLESTLKRKANEDVNYNMSNKKLCSQSGEGDNLQFSNDVLNEILNNNNGTFKVKDEAINQESLSDNKNVIDARDQNFKQIYDASSQDKNETSALNSTLKSEFKSVDQSFSFKQDTCEYQGANELDTQATSKETSDNLKNLDPPSQNNEPVTTKDTKSPVSTETDRSQVPVNVALNSSRREKCKYGKKCYRRSQQHKAEFSHPGDSDYNTPDDRKVCPYGAQCYRKNPQHKMQFKHIAIKNTSDRSDRHRKQIPKRVPLDDLSETEDLSTEESVDESEYEPSSDAESLDDDEVYLDKSESENEWEDDTID